MMHFETIETERLFLKKLTPKDLRSIFAELPEAEAMALLGNATREEYLRDKAKSDGGYETYDRSIVAFLLVSKETGETLGRAGFHNWYFDHRRSEIGYVLFKEAERQKGYMTEALRAIVSYGFREMNLNRIEALISPQNAPSLAIVEKLGFTREGHLRQHYVIQGVAEDSLLFALLREESTLKPTL